MEYSKIVNGSIEFRDAVMKLDSQNLPVYARRECSRNPTYRIMTAYFPSMTVGDLFYSTYPPVKMEDFATALVYASREGEVPLIEVFTL